MNLIVSRRAVRRLMEIASYIHLRNPAAALSVRATLQNTFTLIAARPFIGRPFDDRVRRFAVPRLPYVILYEVAEDVGEVTILTIRHTAQKEKV